MPFSGLNEVCFHAWPSYGLYNPTYLILSFGIFIKAIHVCNKHKCLSWKGAVLGPNPSPQPRSNLHMASLTWHMLEETLHNTSVFKLHLLINLDILPFMKDKNSAQKLPPYHPASSPDELQCACFVAFAFGVSSEKPLCFPRNPFFCPQRMCF